MCSVLKTLMSSALRNYRLLTFSQYQHSLSAATTAAAAAAAAATTSSSSGSGDGSSGRRVSDEVCTKRRLSDSDVTESSAKKPRYQTSATA